MTAKDSFNIFTKKIGKYPYKEIDMTEGLLGKDTGIAQSEVVNNVRIETVKEGFIVRADSNLDVEVTDMLGRVVAKDKANKVIPVSSNGIYLITTGGRTYKVGK